jgi:hypothetical protein
MGRRALLKGGLLVGFFPLARALPVAGMAIYDSRFGTRPAPSMQTIDLVDERTTHWATIRSGLGQTRRVDGTTTWSDYVMIAHELERRGFRRAAEVQQGRLWRFTLLRRHRRNG